jgi:EAL domain-containing protein (putative c-di-GMP-specific phosphodiesterase class I)
MVRGVVALARALELTVTGEGIETEEQFGHLRDMGCHEAQGYYLGRPAPAERLFEAAARRAA